MLVSFVAPAVRALVVTPWRHPQRHQRPRCWLRHQSGREKVANNSKMKRESQWTTRKHRNLSKFSRRRSRNELHLSPLRPHRRKKPLRRRLRRFGWCQQRSQRQRSRARRPPFKGPRVPFKGPRGHFKGPGVLLEAPGVLLKTPGAPLKAPGVLLKDPGVL